MAFNAEAAKKVVEAVREAMKISDEVNLGRTRHNPNLPDVVKQDYSWDVKQEELDKFETIVHLLVCSIFGVDCDGDRAIDWAFVNRKTDETILPYLRVPRVRHGDSEDKHWQQLSVIHANLRQWQSAYDTALRIYEFERQRSQKKEETQ